MKLTPLQHDFDKDPPPERVLVRLFFAALLLVIAGYALSLRWGAINPQALWLDDAWVGMACRAKTWSDFLVITTCSPLAYSLLNLLMCRLIPDPEVALQFIPLVSSLSQIPLLYLIVSRLSGSRFAGLVAALIIAVSPDSLIYSVRAKQYLLDSFLISLLVYLFVSISRSRYWGHFALACVGGAIAVVFSYVTLLLSAPFLHLRALWLFIASRGGALREEPTATVRRSLLALVSYDLFIGLFYLLVLSRQNTPGLATYWREHFLSIQGGLSAYIVTSYNAVARVFLDAFPVHVGDGFLGYLLGALAILGVYDMARRAALLPLAGAIVCSYVGLVSLATLRMYPIGGGRTDIFLAPLSVLVACVGLVFASRKVVGALGMFGGRGRSSWMSPLAMVLVQAALLYPLVTHVESRAIGRRKINYPKEGGAARYIRYINHQLRRDSILVVHPLGRWALGMYGRWAFDVVPDTTLKGWTTTYNSRLPIHFLPLVPRSRYASAVAPLAVSMGRQRHKRLLLFGSHLVGRRFMLDEFKKQLLQEGYRLRSARGQKGAILWIFERPEQGAA